MYWASSCGGCDISLLEIAEHLLELIEMADIVFWPCVADFKYRDVAGYPDGYIDVCLFNGAIRSSEQEEIARLLRRKSRTLVAYGACAMDGGIPALANLKSRDEIFDASYHSNPTLQNPGRTSNRTSTGRAPHGDLTLPRFYPQVLRLADVVEVDYQLPGCPPVRRAGLEGRCRRWSPARCPPRNDARPRRLRRPVGLRRVPPREAQGPDQASSSGRTSRCPSRTGACSSRGSSAWARRRAAAAARCARRPTCRAAAATAPPGDGRRPGHGDAERHRVDARRDHRGPGARDWWTQIVDPTGTFYRFSLASSTLKGRR